LPPDKAHPIAPGTVEDVSVRGAYGFKLAGFDDEAGLNDVPAEWPLLRVEERAAEGGDPFDRVDIGPDRAIVPLLGDVLLTVEREPAKATYWTPRRLGRESILHPYLAPAAAIASWWIGRETFHGGGLILRDGVWAILGDKGSGKSSLLAWFASQGHGVLTDDALVVEKGRTYVGPRSIDLRNVPERLHSAAEFVGVIGDRERWRIRLPHAPATLELRGWVILEWAEDVRVGSVAADTLFEHLISQRMVLLRPPDPVRLLEHATLPGFRLRRPKRWDAVERGAEALLRALA
jgi:hypothetical protein